VRALAVDKTGTLTIGRPDVVDVQTVSAFDAETGLPPAPPLGAPPEPPSAGAIVRPAQHEGVAIPPVVAFEALPGRGVQGRVGSRDVQVGSAGRARRRRARPRAG